MDQINGKSSLTQVIQATMRHGYMRHQPSMGYSIVPGDAHHGVMKRFLW